MSNSVLVSRMKRPRKCHRFLNNAICNINSCVTSETRGLFLILDLEIEFRQQQLPPRPKHYFLTHHTKAISARNINCYEMLNLYLKIHTMKI